MQLADVANGYLISGNTMACIVQEPTAFLGGFFAGFLGLSLDQDPLRNWIEQTAADPQASTK